MRTTAQVLEFLSQLPKQYPEWLRQLRLGIRQDLGNQTQFLLGQVSVETTERYLGCKQRLRGAVNGKIGLEP